MGLTKQYLRYVPAGTFNVIASPKCNSVFIVLDGQEGRFVAVGACEHIFIWDLRLGQKVQVLSGDKFEVTCLSASPNKRHLAAGYTDGTVQVFDLQSGEIVSIFSGHKSDVTTLVFDQFGHKLASGSKDTEIVVWDTVAEAGICRLSGHKNIVTQLVFMTESNVLISGSKDTFVKFWDLDSQYCFKTLVGHRTEVWGLTLMKQDRYLVTGCGDSELRVWKLVVKNDVKNKPPVDQLATNLEFTDLENGTEDDLNYPLQCHKTGSVLRSGRGRVVSICSDVSGQVLGCHGPDNQLELFIFYSDDDATARLKKRQRKERKKQKSTDENDESQTKESSQDLSLSLRDEVRRLPAVKLSQKPKSLDLILGGNGELRIVTVLSDNTLELYSLATLVKDENASLLRSISGHKGEMRAVAVSSDGMAFASAGADSLKIWNRMSQVCLRTVETKGYALSVVFVPGDRHALIGMKDGRLVIADISAGDVLEEIPAHGEELWCICLTPDLRGCVTGGGDNTVKFWQFELISDPQEEIKAKVLSLLHTRTLKLEEKVLSVKISPNNKLVAVALLDSTVKIFFVDTFKFYLSLYGHKLPVLCMDISSDSTLIATGSADRNVKLWGLDFGDCHKSLFAHDDSVTSLQFVPKTHYFFTCGRDGKVKEWDGDSYNKIITLQGHSGEVWTLAVSPDGRHVISAGADRALRLWQRTDEPLVLEDEEEEEREANERLITGEETVVAGRGVVTLPTRKTVGSEKAADSLLECLEVYTTYSEQLAEHCSSDEVVTQPELPPIMQALQVNTVNDFLIETLKRIRSSDLEEALLLLPFTTACVLLRALADCASLGCEMELLARVVVFTLRLHAGSIHATPDLVPTLRLLQKHVIGSINNLRDITGYNLYGLQYLQRELETQESIQLFRDATLTKKKQDNKRRQRDKLKRTLLTLS